MGWNGEGEYGWDGRVFMVGAFDGLLYKAAYEL